jgi:hypothetical protein
MRFDASGESKELSDEVKTALLIESHSSLGRRRIQKEKEEI